MDKIQPAFSRPAAHSTPTLKAERERLLALIRQRGSNQRGCYGAIKMVACISDILDTRTDA